MALVAIKAALVTDTELHEQVRNLWKDWLEAHARGGGGSAAIPQADQGSPHGSR